MISGDDSSQVVTWPTVIGVVTVGMSAVNLLLCVLYVIAVVVQWGLLGLLAGCLAVPIGIAAFLGLRAGTALLQRSRLAQARFPVFALVTAATSDVCIVLIGPGAYGAGASLFSGETNPDTIGAFAVFFGWVFWHLMCLVYSIFLLIWFFRRTVRAQVDAWPNGPAAQRREGGES